MAQIKPRRIKQPFTFVPSKHMYTIMYIDNNLVCLPIINTRYDNTELKENALHLLNNKYNLSIQNMDDTITIPKGTSINIMCNNVTVYLDNKVVPSHKLNIIQLGKIGKDDIYDMRETFGIDAIVKSYCTRTVYLGIIMTTDELDYDLLKNKSDKTPHYGHLHALPATFTFHPEQHLKIAMHLQKKLQRSPVHTSIFQNDVIALLEKNYGVKLRDFDTRLSLMEKTKIKIMEHSDTKTVIRLGCIGDCSGEWITDDEVINYYNRKIYVEVEVPHTAMMLYQNQI